MLSAMSPTEKAEALRQLELNSMRGSFVNPDIGRLDIPAPYPGGEIGAPRALPSGPGPSAAQIALQTLVGPGGVFGAPLPPDLAAREIQRAQTTGDRDFAQSRQAMSQMQEPFWTLVGGGAFMPRTNPRVMSRPATQRETLLENYEIPPRAQAPAPNQTPRPDQTPRTGLPQSVSGGYYEMPGTRGLLTGNVPSQSIARSPAGPAQGPMAPGDVRGQLPLYPYGTPEAQAQSAAQATSKIGAAVKAGSITPEQALRAQLRQQELLGELATTRGDLANTAPRVNAPGNIVPRVPSRDIPGQLGLGQIYRQKARDFDDALYRILSGQ